MLFPVRSDPSAGLMGMNVTQEEIKTIYKPSKDTRYSFIELPEKLQDKFYVLAKVELDKGDIAAQAAVELQQSPEVAAKRSYRLGVLNMRGLYEVLPTLGAHPVERLSYLAQETIDHLREGVWDEDMTKEDIKRSIDVLLTIRSLIVMSFHEYPGNMDTELIQEAFRTADTVEEDIFLGKACVNRTCASFFHYFPDVEIHSTSTES